jgi:hypothetical protein
MKAGDLVRIKRQFIGAHDPVGYGVVIEKLATHVSIMFEGIMVPRHKSMIEVVCESQ